MRIDVTYTDVEATLAILQEGGRAGTECVALWLGRTANGGIVVHEVYRPIHEAKADVFWITEVGMDELKAHLRRTRTMVAAQVHTHPGRAFHSDADDRWAIVRHEGAISIVLPEFALNTSALTFERDAMVYRLDDANDWCELKREKMEEHLCLR
jgi:hypothetical protein